MSVTGVGGGFDKRLQEIGGGLLSSPIREHAVNRIMTGGSEKASGPVGGISNADFRSIMQDSLAGSAGVQGQSTVDTVSSAYFDNSAQVRGKVDNIV